MTFCFERGFLPKTITTYIAGLNYYHKLSGFYDITHVFVISKLLEGCRRNRLSRDNRAPLTKPLLKAVCSILPEVCYDTYETKMFSSVFTLAYFGLFRVSELVAVSSSRVGFPIEYSDLSFSGNKYVSIRLRHSKTNHSGRPIILKIPKEIGQICPVRMLTEFVIIRPRHQGVLFCHRDSSVVTRTQFSAVLNKCIGRLGLSGTYRTHSFRIGRASDLASAGLNSQAIMKLGRWTSNSYKLYIRA